MDRRAVFELADRHERLAVGRVHLTEIAAAPQAVVALAAVRRVGHEHAVARPHARDRRADRFDDARRPRVRGCARRPHLPRRRQVPCRGPGSRSCNSTASLRCGWPPCCRAAAASVRRGPMRPRRSGCTHGTAVAPAPDARHPAARTRRRHSPRRRSRPPHLA